MSPPGYARFRLLLGQRTPPVVIPPSGKTPPGVFSMNANYSGLENMDASAADVPSVAFLSYLVSQGIKNVRLPLSWQKTSSVGTLVGLQHGTTVALDTTYLGWVDQALTNAATAGVKLLLDVHEYGNGPGGTVGSTAVPISAFADLHSRFATWLLGGSGGTSHPEAVLGIDLMNEWVNGFDSTIIFNASQAAINAIRAAGFTKRIYVEGTNYTGAWNWVSGQQTDGSIKFNSAGLAALVDPANNLVFEAHMYLDHDNSGRYGAWGVEVAHDPNTPGDANAPPGTRVSTSIGLTRLAPFVAWCQQHGVRGCIGELGWGNDFPTTPGAVFDFADWNAAADAAIALCQKNNIEVFAWGTGSNAGFGPNYIYLIEPVAGDRSAKVDSAAGVQAPQMTVIQKYTGVQGPPATAYGLIPPYNADGTPNRRATSGQTTAPFHVFYGGKLTAPVTVTPFATLADGTTPAPGTFAPTSVTLQPGDNALANFTFTPTSAATMQVGTTNSRGLTDPPLQVISSVVETVPGLGAPFINAYAPRRLPWANGLSIYIGPKYRLQRASDGAQKDFALNNRGDLPRQAIQDWAQSRSIQIVTDYDTSGAGNHKTWPGNNQYNSPRTGDAKPILTLVGASGYPEVTWPSGASMTGNISVQGDNAFTAIAAYKGGNGGPYFRQDQYVGPLVWGGGTFGLDGGGGAPRGSISINISVSLNEDAANWHDYAVTYTSGVSLKSYRDGTLQNTTADPTTGQANNPANPTQGYTPDPAYGAGVTEWGYFYYGGNWTGSDRGMAYVAQALTDAQLAAIHAEIATYYATALPDTLSAVAPTIGGTAATTCVQGSNDAPFSAVTIADTNSGSPTDTVSIVLSGGAGTLTGTGLTGAGTSANPYALAADTAANVQAKLRALQWTPSGAAGSSTTFSLTVTSSAGTSASDNKTVVTVQAYQAETPYAAPSATFTPMAGTAAFKGVNIGGANNAYPSSSQYNYIYPQPKEFDYLSGKGLGIIRMNVGSHRLYPVAYSLLDPINRTDEPAVAGSTPGTNTNLIAIKNALDYALTKRMYVIIDNHDSAGTIYDSRSNTNQNAGDGGVGTALFADFWSRIATKYKNYPNVIFGLANEPAGLTAAQFKVAAVAALAAIRAAGANQLVLIAGGGNYDDAEPWATTMGTIWDTFNQPGWTGTNGDPANNFAFEGHKYFNAAGGGSQYGNDGQGSNYRNVTGAQLLGGMTTWCRQTNAGVARANPFKAFLGEMGWTPDGSTSISGQATPASGSATPSVVSNSMLDFMNANSDVWLGWTFFVGGSWAFFAGYKWGHVVPQNSNGDPSTYVDQPQMAQLTAHL